MCDVRVASGEWRVASGEWRVASGEWPKMAIQVKEELAIVEQVIGI
jgi:hypothetical protein